MRPDGTNALEFTVSRMKRWKLGNRLQGVTHEDFTAQFAFRIGYNVLQGFNRNGEDPRSADFKKEEHLGQRRPRARD